MSGAAARARGAREAAEGTAQGPPGDIARVRFSAPGTINRFGGGQLPLPGGIAFGPDDHAYVTIGSADTTPGAGAVVRVATTG